MHVCNDRVKGTSWLFQKAENAGCKPQPSCHDLISSSSSPERIYAEAGYEPPGGLPPAGSWPIGGEVNTLCNVSVNQPQKPASTPLYWMQSAPQNVGRAPWPGHEAARFETSVTHAAGTLWNWPTKEQLAGFEPTAALGQYQEGKKERRKEGKKERRKERKKGTNHPPHKN